jgi:hypothetical protein
MQLKHYSIIIVLLGLILLDEFAFGQRYDWRQDLRKVEHLDPNNRLVEQIASIDFIADSIFLNKNITNKAIQIKIIILTNDHKDSAQTIYGRLNDSVFYQNWGGTDTSFFGLYKNNRKYYRNGCNPIVYKTCNILLDTFELQTERIDSAGNSFTYKHNSINYSDSLIINETTFYNNRIGGTMPPEYDHLKYTTQTTLYFKDHRRITNAVIKRFLDDKFENSIKATIKYIN